MRSILTTLPICVYNTPLSPKNGWFTVHLSSLADLCVVLPASVWSFNLVNRSPNPGNRRARADAKATFNFVYRNSDFVCPGGRSYPICHDMLRLKVSSTRRLSHLVTACTQSNEMEFAKKSCVPCESKDLRPMSEQVANELLQQVPGWGISEEDGKLKLHRAWKVKSFMKGLEFFRRVADVAEAEGHHPDLHLVNWNNVKIDIWTHSIGGLTENDFILAAKISALDVESLLRKKTAAAESHTLP